MPWLDKYWLSYVFDFWAQLGMSRPRLVDWLVGWLVSYLVGSLVAWFIARLVGWLVGRLVG